MTSNPIVSIQLVVQNDRLSGVSLLDLWKATALLCSGVSDALSARQMQKGGEFVEKWSTGSVVRRRGMFGGRKS